MSLQALPQAATEFDRLQRLEQQAAISALRRQWRRMGSDFDSSFARVLPTLISILDHAQSQTVSHSAEFVPNVLRQTGQGYHATATVDDQQFVGWSGSGERTEDVLMLAPIRAKQQISAGATVPQALTSAESWLTGTAGTILSDTARSSTSLHSFSRRSQGYVRMLVPPSCGRCAILGGRFYRWNSGFQRHPRCDCRHIPTSEAIAGDMTLDVNAYFGSLDKAGQAKLVGSQANAQAVRDGADINQVVNAYRSSAGLRLAQEPAIKVTRLSDGSIDKFTTEGSTKHSAAYRAQKALRSHGEVQLRLMPESIYARAADRDDAMRMLKLYGWILP